MKYRATISLLTLAVLCVLAVASTALAFGRERGVLSVVFLDVGQGDAILIESPTGRQMLVDAGPDASVIRELGAVMPLADHSIDVLLATHPDADHIGGIPDVLERYEVGAFVESGAAGKTTLAASVSELVEAQSVPNVAARRGMRISLGAGVFADVLYPFSDVDVAGADTNAASVVLRLSYGSTCVILTGDAPKFVEVRLIEENPALLDCDILKLGHHGSKTSSAPLFLEAVSPEVGVVSAGKDNRYGHPHQEVLEAAEAAGIAVVSTAGEGSIVFTSDGVGVTRIR